MKSVSVRASRVFPVIAAVVALHPLDVAAEGLLANDRPDPTGQPTRVAFAVFVVNINDIDGATQTFNADVLTVLKWRDPRAARQPGDPSTRPLTDVWHPRLGIVNQQGAQPQLPLAVEVEPEGALTYVQRYQGRFSSPMNVADFPFDGHTCRLRFVSLGYSESEVVFDNTPFKELSGMARELLIADWRVGDWTLNAEAFQPHPGAPRRAGILFTFDVQRYSGYYVVKVLLPLMFIVFMSWVVFWIDPIHVGSQTGVAVTSMLTLIAYRFSFDGQLPRVSYLTRMDAFMLGATILVLLSLVEVAVTSNLAGAQKRSLAIRIDRWSRGVFPAAFVMLILWSMFW